MEQNYGLADFRQPGIQNKEANSSLVMPDLVDLLNQTEYRPHDYQLTVQPDESYEEPVVDQTVTKESLKMPVVNQSVNQTVMEDSSVEKRTELT